MTTQTSAAHAKDAPYEEHVWINIERSGVIVRRFCDDCGVTPLEWLGLQPITDAAALSADATGAEGGEG